MSKSSKTLRAMVKLEVRFTSGTIPEIESIQLTDEKDIYQWTVVLYPIGVSPQGLGQTPWKLDFSIWKYIFQSKFGNRFVPTQFLFADQLIPYFFIEKTNNNTLDHGLNKMNGTSRVCIMDIVRQKIRFLSKNLDSLEMQQNILLRELIRIGNQFKKMLRDEYLRRLVIHNQSRQDEILNRISAQLIELRMNGRVPFMEPLRSTSLKPGLGLQDEKTPHATTSTTVTKLNGGTRSPSRRQLVSPIATLPSLSASSPSALKTTLPPQIEELVDDYYGPQ